MDFRKIALDSLNHKDGKVPMDFGASSITGVHCSITDKLRDFYGLEKRPAKVIEPYQMLGEIDDELRSILGIATKPILGRYSMMGNELSAWKLWKTPWGQEVLMPQTFAYDEKPEGVYAYPKGDKSVAPSVFMPKKGYFFDSLHRQSCYDEDNPNLADNLEEFKELDSDDINFLKTRVAELNGEHNYLHVAHLPGTALGDIALVPAPFMENPKGIRGVEDWYMMIASNEEFIDKLFAAQCEISIKNLEKLKDVFGDMLDVAVVCGTDFGTQTSTFCSVEKYRRLWLPHYKKLNDWIHKNTSWKTFKHSCGAIECLLESFIDSGFDIINPVQCSATGMDAKLIKNKYGDRITFWGAGVDTQKTLPFESASQVRSQVLERLEIFSKGGGFMFNSIHNVQALTPVENFVAMIDTVKEYNK